LSQRIVDQWNKLPDDVVSAATISSFKKRLDIQWSGLKPGPAQPSKTQPVQPNYWPGTMASI